MEGGVLLLDFWLVINWLMLVIEFFRCDWNYVLLVFDFDGLWVWILLLNIVLGNFVFNLGNVSYGLFDWCDWYL